MSNQTLSPLKRSIVGVQFMFVAFGSTVLVPLLVGFDPAIALLAAGLGTLLFHGVTGGKVPIFLGSSFAFIAPIVKATELYGMPGMFCGLVAVGVVYLIMSLFVKLFGTNFIKRLFPPIVIGPVIILIGLSLAGTGVNMASQNWVLAIISLLVAIACSIWGKGLIKIIPVFFGAIAGYIAAVIFFRSGMDFAPVAQAKWFALPHFTKMSFSWQAIVFMAPVAIAPIIEHVGDVYAISEIAGKDFVKDPGLHRTMAALSAIIVSLIGKVGAAIQTIPSAVLGGIMLLLFGSIASVGINNLVKAKIDMNKTRNLIIASLILTIGIGGAIVSFGKFSLAGIGLASIVGVILNLIIPDKEKATAPETVEEAE